jgi:hypothetical protein
MMEPELLARRKVFGPKSKPDPNSGPELTKMHAHGNTSLGWGLKRKYTKLRLAMQGTIGKESNKAKRITENEALFGIRIDWNLNKN